jgi:hypothetical protein
MGSGSLGSSAAARSQVGTSALESPRKRLGLSTRALALKSDSVSGAS